jgi:hypothetical protein
MMRLFFTFKEDENDDSECINTDQFKEIAATGF